MKVEAASINPSDVLFVSGKYNQEPGKDKEIPAYVGFEGMLNAAIRCRPPLLLFLFFFSLSLQYKSVHCHLGQNEALNLQLVHGRMRTRRPSGLLC